MCQQITARFKNCGHPNGQGSVRCLAFRRTDPAFEPSLYQGQLPPSGNAIFQGRDKDLKMVPAIQSACTNRRQFGAIRIELGNLRLCRTAWWGWEDSNFQPNDYRLLASEVPEVSGFVCASALSPEIAD